MLAIRCVVAFILLCSVFVSSFSDAASYIRPVSASASSSYGSGTPSKAIDGNASTTWNAGGSATRWITVDLGAQYQISYVRMRVNQHPSGQTTHRVYAGASSSGMSYVTQLSGNTSSGQWLTASGNYGTVRYIKVETTQSPSWVAWFEIQPYGTVPPPARPSGVSINPSTVHTSQNFSMSWGNVSGASRYVIQRSTNNYHWYSAATVYSNSASFNESSPGSYYYRVSACNSSGSCSSYSSSRSVNVITPPPGPLKSSFDGTIFDAQTMSGWACEVGSGSSVYYKIYSQNSSGNLDQVLHEGWANASSSGAIHNSSNCNANGSFRFHWYMTNTEIANHCGKTMRLRAYRNQQDSNPRLDVYSRSISCDAETKAGSISIPSQTVIKGNSYSVNWSGFSGPISKYYLEEKYESGPWGNIATISSSSGSGTRTIGGKSSKGRYYYRVKACGAFSACTDWVEPNGGSVLIGDDIIGSLDGPAPYPAIIAGWACARGSSDSLNIEIRKLSDGQVVHSAVANLQSEPAISSASNCNAQGQYRFLWEMSYAQQQLMCNQAMRLYAYTSDNPADKRQVVGTKTGICPGTISVPSASVNIGSSFDVTWDNFGGPVQKYILEESTSGGAWSNVADNITPATSSYTIAAKSQAGDFKYRVKACYSSVLCTDFSESNQVSVEKLGTGEIKGWFDGTAGGLGTLAGWVCEVENPSALQIKLYELDENDNEVAVRHQQSTDIATNPNGPIASAEFCKAAGDYHFNWNATAESCGKTFRLKAVLDGQEHTVIPDRLLACNESEIIKLGSYVNLNEDYPIQWALFQAGQDTYELEESFEGGAWTLRSTVHSRVTKLTIPGKTVLGKYRYRIRGCDLNNQCTDYKYSNFITVIDTVPGAIKGYFDGTAGGLGTLSGWACKVNDQTPMQVKLYEVDDNGAEVAVRHTQTTNIFADENSELTSPEFCNVTGNFHFKWSPSVDQCRKTFRVKAVDGSTEQVVGPDRYLACNSSEVIKLPASAKVNESYPLEWAIFEPEIHKFEVQDRFEDGPWVLRHDIHSRVTKLQIPGKQNTGRYQYRIRGCKLDGSCTAYRQSNHILITPNDDLGPEKPGDLVSDPSADNGILPGTSAGSFRVSESGAATYSMPIMSAQGTAGVSPQISLNYSSQSGNGPLGVGWSVSGASSISRCRQTLSIDGIAKAITWSNEDRFCLDGQRLLRVGGAEYGEVGSVYRTEIDSFALITLKENSHTKYFEVERKDGSVSTYGVDEYSQHIMNPEGHVLTWYISSFKDSVGNPINYLYSTQDGSNPKYISSIEFAFGADHDNARAAIEFNYITRPDPIAGYVSGYKHVLDKRLDSIVSLNEGVVLREYNLNYNSNSDASSLSRIASVQECDGGSSPICFRPTVFGWDLAGESSIQLEKDRETDNQENLGSGNYVVDFKQGDIDGDGILDVVWLKAHLLDDGNYSSHHLFFALGGQGYKATATHHRPELQGPFKKPFRIEVFDYNNNGVSDVLLFETDEMNISPSGNEGRWVLMGGSLDANNNNEWRIGPTQEVIPFTKRNVIFSDVNSDGLIDASVHLPEEAIHAATDLTTEYFLLKEKSGNSSVEFPYGYDLSAPNLIPLDDNEGIPSRRVRGAVASAGDLNGDGRLDYVLVEKQGPALGLMVNQGFYLALNNGDSLDLFNEAGGQLPFDRLDSTRFVDVNLDGLSDIVYWDSIDKAWKLGINDGTKINYLTASILGASSLEKAKSQALQTVDVNGDGYLDFTWYDGDFLKAKLWDLSSESYSNEIITLTESGVASEEGNFLFDYSGDGNVDLMSFSGTRFIWSKGREESNRIKKITNGLSAETVIEYSDLSDGSIYTRASDLGSGCNLECQTYSPFNGSHGLQNEKPFSPVINIGGSFIVVKSVSSSAPTVESALAKSTIRYEYGKGRIQAGGRGFLGFEILTTIDAQSNIRTTTQYRQDWPFIGYPVKTEVFTQSNQLLSRSTNTWKLVGFADHWLTSARTGSASLGALQPYIQQSEEVSFALNTQMMLSKTRTTNVYDDYGNPTDISVSVYDGGNTLVQMKHTDNRYTASGFGAAESARLGRLSSSTVTTTRDGLPQIRKSSFEYYTDATLRGLLKSETVEPDSAVGCSDEWIQTQHFYDGFGNKTHAQSTACDGHAVVTRSSDRHIYDPSGRYVNETLRFFPGQSTAGSLVASVEDRNNYGAPSEVHSLNGVVSNSYFGPMGRAYASDSSIQAWTRQYLKENYNHCPAYTAYAAVSEGADGTVTAECYDILARSTRKLHQNIDGAWVAVDTAYDNLGRVKRVSEPYYFPSGSKYYSENFYDVLSRLIKITLPRESLSEQRELKFDYLGLQVTSTAANGKRKIELKNALGELVRVTDHLGTVINYQYDVNGNLENVSFPSFSNKNISMTYDKLGRKLTMTDPDKGFWEYEYNGFGELISQTDAEKQTTEMHYDSLGRMVQRKDHDGQVSIWTYNNDVSSTGAGQIGSVQSVKSNGDAAEKFAETYSYDNYGRPVSTLYSIDSVDINTGSYLSSFESSQEYDDFGRVSVVRDVAATKVLGSLGLMHDYNKYGHLVRIADEDGSRPVYVSYLDADQRSNITSMRLGNGITQQQRFNVRTGSIAGIKSFKAANDPVYTQDLTYEWDNVGNLVSRSEKSSGKNFEESFVYDDLNRLTKVSSVVGGQNRPDLILEYDLAGNIKRKSDVGYYHYDAVLSDGPSSRSLPHAVSKVTTDIAGANSVNGYSYDANGNVENITGSNPRSFSYTSFGKVKRIQKGSNGPTTEFWYGADRSRYKRVDRDGNNEVSTYYLGGVELKKLPSGMYEYKRPVAGVAIQTLHVDSNGVLTDSMDHYIHKDHLGSTDVITDESGNIAQVMSFDAWGARRDALNWDTLDPNMLVQEFSAFNVRQVSAGDNLKALLGPITNRGFTGHEMLDDVGIIHMNGRIYDARLGRFLQADPNIDGVDSTQGYNRYAYVHNNPLNATDPTGYFKLKQFAGLIVGAVLTFATGGLGAGAFASTWYGAATIGAVSGAIGAAVNGGNILRGALIGGVSGAAFSGAGSLFRGSGALAHLRGGFRYFAQVAVHGTIGGITNILTGGKFGHGFATAGFAKFFSVGALKLGLDGAGQFFAATIAGGTASKVTGGKFANGATTAALAYVVNQAAAGGPKKASTKKGIGAVPGYDETGSNSWRASNDQTFIDAANAYNAKHGLSPGDAGYWTPQRLKAQAMIESGGDKAAFLSDPLQVNVNGDWVPKKASLLGLTKGQAMTPATSAAAALEWMNYKGHVHNAAGAQVSYRGVYQALRRYNGNTRIYPKHPGVQHRDWYASQVLSLESQM